MWLWGVCNAFPKSVIAVINVCLGRNVSVETLIHTTIQNYTGTQAQTESGHVAFLRPKGRERKGQSVTYDKGQHQKNTSVCCH